MPNANYRRGARLERLLMAQLKRNGWHVVRSAGSKGPVDLVAWDATLMVAIQVKAPGAVRKDDVEKLRRVIVPDGMTRWIYEYVGGAEDWKAVSVE